MKSRLILIALVSVMGLATGCSSWHGSGTVVQKQYDPPYDTLQKICAAYNSRGTCSLYMPEVIRYEAEWQFKVRSTSDSKTHWVEVTEDQYDRTDVGAAFANGEDS